MKKLIKKKGNIEIMVTRKRQKEKVPKKKLKKKKENRK